MNIGIITTWFERGAAYVSKAYMEELTKQGNHVFIFARGGENNGKGDPNWDFEYVTWGKNYRTTKIDKKQLYKWIEQHSLDVLFFNEQQEWKIVADTKKDKPQLKIGAYIDYYTEKTLAFYEIYDFVICNTLRHQEALETHPQAYYIRWGTNIDLYVPREHSDNSSCVKFFHSVGMSPRKGTDLLVRAFIDGKLYEKSKLILHTQIPIQKVCDYTSDELSSYGIEVVERTVTAPGLYYMGDVYVYPTKLEGLGLTLYEALASGLPVITTDFPPMNEVIDDSVGRLVKVRRNYARADGYYWPLAECDKEDLIKAMEAFIDNSNLADMKIRAREKALQYYNWEVNAKELSDIFERAKVKEYNPKIYYRIVQYERQKKREPIKQFIMNNHLLFSLLKVARDIIK